MNIFVLDTRLKKCVQYYCDQHVIKMLLEYAQILCTVCNEWGIKTPYRSTHRRHPCVLWACQSIQNWRWLKKLATALNAEYQYRFQTTEPHLSYTVIASLEEPALPNVPRTPFVQVVPEAYKIPNDPVQTYRNYYTQEKMHFARWTKRKKPYWAWAKKRTS